jgi:predicted DNA-binding transcriptional regulator YafY
MRRADRLFRLTQLIRGRRRSTAAWLSERLEVSLRTVYRDVADLQAQGVPIEGEAGVGYRMGAGFDLPPLMFSAEEACALVAALRLAQPQMDPALAAQGELALGRILSVLPPACGPRPRAGLVGAGPGPDAATLQRLGLLRQAIAGRQRVQFHYRDAGPKAASAACGRWAASSGARSGPWAPGASCGRTSAASGWTASTRSPRRTAAFATSPAAAWPTTCATPARPRMP